MHGAKMRKYNILANSSRRPEYRPRKFYSDVRDLDKKAKTNKAASAADKDAQVTISLVVNFKNLELHLISSRLDAMTFPFDSKSLQEARVAYEQAVKLSEQLN